MAHPRKPVLRSPLGGLGKGTKRAADIDGEIARRYRRNVLGLFAVCAAGLVPWTIFLALTLAPAYQAHHWKLVWAGFDALLFLSMTATAYLGWRRRQAVIGAAVATATLLICDAWFDIALDLGTPDVWGSLASALLVELPLAGFLLSRAYLLMKLSAELVYSALGYSEPPHALHKMPMFALEELLRK